MSAFDWNIALGIGVPTAPSDQPHAAHAEFVVGTGGWAAAAGAVGAATIASVDAADSAVVTIAASALAIGTAFSCRRKLTSPTMTDP
jgi:hypothetical protein